MPQTFHHEGQYNCTAEEMDPARNSIIILSDSVELHVDKKIDDKCDGRK